MPASMLPGPWRRTLRPSIDCPVDASPAASMLCRGVDVVVASMLQMLVRRRGYGTESTGDSPDPCAWADGSAASPIAPLSTSPPTLPRSRRHDSRRTLPCGRELASAPLKPCRTGRRPARPSTTPTCPPIPSGAPPPPRPLLSITNVYFLWYKGKRDNAGQDLQVERKSRLRVRVVIVRMRE